MPPRTRRKPEVDRHRITITSVGSLSTGASGTLDMPAIRENARYAVHHQVVTRVKPDEQEEALDELLDMLGLKLTAADVVAGYDRRTPLRPNLTPQLPDGGERYDSGNIKRKRRKVALRDE